MQPRSITVTFFETDDGNVRDVRLYGVEGMTTWFVAAVLEHSAESLVSGLADMETSSVH